MHYGNYSRQPSVEWERFYKTSRWRREFGVATVIARAQGSVTNAAQTTLAAFETARNTGLARRTTVTAPANRWACAIYPG
jgi:hypothetical protein